MIALCTNTACPMRSECARGQEPRGDNTNHVHFEPEGFNFMGVAMGWCCEGYVSKEKP